MSAINIEPAFDSDSCCQGASTTAAPQGNANLYYDITIYANPTAAGLVPANLSLPCVAFELNGSGPSFVWNPSLGLWK